MTDEPIDTKKASLEALQKMRRDLIEQHERNLKEIDEAIAALENL